MIRHNPSYLPRLASSPSRRGHYLKGREKVMLNIFKKPKQSLGSWGEDYIASEYKKKGYKILDKNYFNRKGKQLGEIDFIALKDRDLAFVDVKTRTNTAYGRPGESVDFF